MVEAISALVSCMNISKSFTCFFDDLHASLALQGTVYLHLQHALSTFVGVVCLSGEVKCSLANDSAVLCSWCIATMPRCCKSGDVLLYQPQ